MKNIIARAEAGKKTMSEDYDLNVSEFLTLAHTATSLNASGLFEPITAAYSAGFDAGVRYGREEATV